MTGPIGLDIEAKLRAAGWKEAGWAKGAGKLWARVRGDVPRTTVAAFAETAGVGTTWAAPSRGAFGGKTCTTTAKGGKREPKG